MLHDKSPSRDQLRQQILSPDRTHTGRPQATRRFLHRCVHIPCQQTLVHRSCKTPQSGDAPAKCGSHQLPAAAPQQARPLHVSHQASQLALQCDAQADRAGSGCTRWQNCRKTQQCPMPYLRMMDSVSLTRVAGTTKYWCAGSNAVAKMPMPRPVHCQTYRDSCKQLEFASKTTLKDFSG